MKPRDAVVAASSPHWRSVRRVLEDAWRNNEWPMRAVRAGLWEAIGHGEIEINLATAKVRRAA